VAADAFLRPPEYLGLLSSHHVRDIVNKIIPAVNGAAKALAAQWGEKIASQPGYREALIETAVVLNAAMKASILRAEFNDTAKPLGVVFGVYDLGSRHVQVPLASSDDDNDRSVHLVDAPTSREGFQQLAGQVVTSLLIRRLLGV
jgi:carbonic anhydrase